MALKRASLLILTLILFFSIENIYGDAFLEKFQGAGSARKYDCYPSVYAERLGLKCGRKGEDTVELLTVAVARCRMPEEWAPEWKCSARNIAEIQKCLKEETSAIIYQVLGKIYFEVARFCKQEVDLETLKFIEKLARKEKETGDLTREMITKHTEAHRLIKEQSEYTKTMMADAVELIEKLSETREEAKKVLEDVTDYFDSPEDRQEEYNKKLSQGVLDLIDQIKMGKTRADEGDINMKRRRRGSRGRVYDDDQQKGKEFSEVYATCLYMMVVLTVLLTFKRVKLAQFLVEMGFHTCAFYFSCFIPNHYIKLAVRMVILYTFKLRF